MMVMRAGPEGLGVDVRGFLETGSRVEEEGAPAPRREEMGRLLDIVGLVGMMSKRLLRRGIFGWVCTQVVYSCMWL